MEYDPSVYVVVTEDILRESCEQLTLEGEPNNSFRKMLDVSDEYKAANLTPIVLYDLRSNSMYCIVKELVGKKLH